MPISIFIYFKFNPVKLDSTVFADEFPKELFCGKQDIESTYCAKGDFDGDGNLDSIGDIRSTVTQDYATFILFAGDTQPIPLTNFQINIQMIYEPKPLEISDSSLKNDFAKLTFTPVTPTPTKAEHKKSNFSIPSGRFCYTTVAKGKLSEGWEEQGVKVSSSHDLVEVRSCDVAGGISLYAFDRGTLKTIQYFSSFAGM